MTMTMTERVASETEIDHIVETDHRITMVEIDHTVEVDHETTIEMTTEMTTEMAVEKKIIGISKTRNIRESTEIIMRTHMKTGTTRKMIEIVTKTKIEIKTDDNYDKIRGRSKEKGCSYRKDDSFKTNLKECTKFYNQCIKKKKW